MLLILAILATSMVAPVHDGDVDCGYSAYMMGKVDWDCNAECAIVTVTGPGGFSESETLWWPDHYCIELDDPEEEDVFTVTCTLIIGLSPYPVDIRPGIVYPDDFVFVYPQKYWAHYEVFVW